jgi:uncharacterized protein (TIGR03437 family)
VGGVALPGEFVLFTAPGSSVNVGSNLAKLPFLNYLGPDGAPAIPGSIYGSGGVGSASSGGVTKQNAIFGHPPQGGHTILSWTLALPSTSNLQLGWSMGMGDGSLSTTGVQFSVRINGATYWTMFQQNPTGWTPASLDLTSWRGQNILVQLVTESIDDNNNYDWGWWADLNLTQSSGACSYTLPSGASFAAGTGTGTAMLSVTGASCPWAATTDVPWISVSSLAAGSGSSTISYSVLANSGAARTGHILAGGQSYAITQAAGLDPLAPTFPAAGLVNGASFLTGMAPGMITTIFGVHLSNASGIVGASQIPLPSQLLGASVSVGGFTAPMFNIVDINGNEQISFQTPWEIATESTAGVVVTNNGHVSAAVPVAVVAANPGVFTTDGTTGVILHGVGNQLITASSPAAKGEVVVIYATGLGAVSPTPADGAATGASQTAATATVAIGGIAGGVQYAGMAPGFVGLYQVNVQIPSSVASGNESVVITINGQTSKTVTMAVQ